MDEKTKNENILQMKNMRIPIKITDETMRGVYANNMMVTHTKEEFVLDFINIFPPGGIVNARIIISPGHLKRIIRALQDNFAKYEQRFSTISEAPEPIIN
jgi:hypothetical protein